MTRDEIHTCSYLCERPACIKAQRDELAQRLLELVAQAVAAEREACAKVCERLPETFKIAADEFGYQAEMPTAENYAAAIRARGEV